MRKKIFNIISLFWFILILWLFYYLNNSNYERLKKINYEFVKHPDLIPNKQFAKYTSFWYANLRADIYWIEAIQYIWSNVIWSEYKKYLFKIIDLITELNPYFEKPYIIWQLLLPTYNENYEKLSEKTQKENIIQWEKIWLKWIENFCNKEKINLIKNETNLEKIWSDSRYKNPCKSFDIPFWLWFIYYYYLNNPKESSLYYKIASANDNSLEWSKVMAAIMSWKWWDREKSIMMFLTLSDKYTSKDEYEKKCSMFSKELQKVSFEVFRKGKTLNWEIVKKINDIRKTDFSFSKEKDDKKIMSSTNCYNYINKAVRELNLAYLDSANSKFFNDNKKYAETSNELFEKKYINYIPVDFQQYDTYWIIYTFNKKTWYFDYKMSNDD